MDPGFIASLTSFCAGSPWLSGLGRMLGEGGVAPVLFLVGLVGGFSHCAGMCGPFVLAQIAGNDARLNRRGMSEMRRLQGALLLPYHLGRMTTYAALGGLAGGTVSLASWLAGYSWLPALLLGLAALLFLSQGLAGLASWLGVSARISGGGALAGALGKLARPFLADPRGWRGYALGVLLGFLPCGLLWGALTAAAGSGSAWEGAAAMAAFVLGTVPGLVLVGYVGVFFGRRAPSALRAVGVPLMLMNAGFLGFLALRAVV